MLVPRLGNGHTREHKPKIKTTITLTQTTKQATQENMT
jgi:hypothetical protein